ncbi:UNVERIFIED_CONTAM: hypothetical protein GTU68_037009 [Idotea baltica]|nr:hypothetical protein [Idotea baltica]
MQQIVFLGLIIIPILTPS